MKTIDEQKAALGCLWYELQMFNETAHRLILGLKQIDFNITIESFCMHLRNLINFLEDKKDGRYIRCSDFNIKNIKVQLSKGVTEKTLNEWANHLTWARVSGKKPNWPPDLIKSVASEINKHFSEFVNNLPDNLFPESRYNNTKEDFLELAKKL